MTELNYSGLEQQPDDQTLAIFVESLTHSTTPPVISTRGVREKQVILHRHLAPRRPTHLGVTGCSGTVSSAESAVPMTAAPPGTYDT